jgi:hypothetical protein
VTRGHALVDGPVRVVAQFLEGGAASAAIDPGAAVACLRRAAEIAPLTDLCLGWNLPQALIAAVGDEARRQGQRLWLWQPLLSGDGVFVPRADATVGRDGRPIPWPREMAEFAFDCPVRRSGRDAALVRLDDAIDGADWDGVLLDKIRWPSPTRDPAADLTCFCGECRQEASSAGVDLEAVAQRLDRGAADGDARIGLLREMLGVDQGEPLASFMSWRTARITEAVAEAARLVRSRRGPGRQPMRVALDVFTPSLAQLVGQDIGELAPLGELTKAMMYLGTHGPAGLPYELCGLTTWLADGGVEDPVGVLGDTLGYALPPHATVCDGVLSPRVFATEIERLRQLAGSGAAAGIDAVGIAAIAVLDDATLRSVTRMAVSAGVDLVLSWDLWAVAPQRLEVVARAIEDASTIGAAS